MRQLGASSYLQPSRRLTTCAVASTSLERWGIDGKAPEKQRDTKCFDSDFHHSEEVAWKSKVDWERATSERPSPDLARPYLLKLPSCPSEKRSTYCLLPFASRWYNPTWAQLHRRLLTSVHHMDMPLWNSMTSAQRRLMGQGGDWRNWTNTTTRWNAKDHILWDLASCHPVGWS